MRFWYKYEPVKILPWEKHTMCRYEQQAVGHMEQASMNQDDRHNVTGVILIGGKSRRMGRDKAFLQISGKTFFEGVLGVLRDSFDRLLLVGDRAECFAGYDLPVLPDIYPGSALGGLYPALHRAETEYIFVSSCDLPFPNGGILRYLCSLRDGRSFVNVNTPEEFEKIKTGGSS